MLDTESMLAEELTVFADVDDLAWRNGFACRYLSLASLTPWWWLSPLKCKRVEARAGNGSPSTWSRSTEETRRVECKFSKEDEDKEKKGVDEVALSESVAAAALLCN